MFSPEYVHRCVLLYYKIDRQNYSEHRTFKNCLEKNLLLLHITIYSLT